LASQPLSTITNGDFTDIKGLISLTLYRPVISMNDNAGFRPRFASSLVHILVVQKMMGTQSGKHILW
jgi:hypothetical protein